MDLPTDPTASLFAEILEGTAARARRPLSLDAGPDILAAIAIAHALWTAVAPWRPTFDALVAAGHSPLPALTDDATGHDLVLVRLGRNRVRSRARIAEAFRRASNDGLVVVAGENDIGAAAYGRALPRAIVRARSHCRGFRMSVRDAPPAELRASWEAEAAMRRHSIHGHVTAPGLFAWDRVDAGSALLARVLPEEIAGEVADLGAGWGYLAAAVAARSGVKRIDLYEADWLALDAARANLTDPRAGFHWHDATRTLPRGGYDVIVTNPPFHATRRADPEIGRRVIRVAQAALRPDGALWLVANRHLPYEQTLREGFAHVEARIEADGYKVLSARGPRTLNQNVPG